MLKKVGILSLLVVASVVSAETKYEGKLKETVITASGFNEENNDQIKNITVITSEDIQNKGYNSVEDVLRNVPGVKISMTEQKNSVVDVRGQGSLGIGTPLSKAVGNVKILIDGAVSMDTTDLSHAYIPLNTIPIDEIEKIEIINGGGTVLYGSGASGGVINIITKKDVKDGVTGKVYYQRSSFETNKFGARTSAKLNDKLILDLGYETIDGNGYRREEENKSRYYSGGLRYQINDNHNLNFKIADYSEKFKIGYPLTEAELLQDRRQPGDLSPVSKFEKIGMAMASRIGSTQGRPNMSQIFSSPDYTKVYPLEENEVKRREYSLGYNGKITDTYKVTAVAYKQNTKRNETLFTDDKKGFNLKNNFEIGKGNVILGYDYFVQKGTRYEPLRMTKVNLRKRSNSLFALVHQEIFENLYATGGYRYELSKFGTERKTSSRSVDENRKENNSAYEIGLNYKYSNTGNIYTKFENGFRSPAATELVDGKTTGYVLNNLKTEKFKTAEIGVKDYIFNSFVSATAFYTKTKNEVYINMNHMGRVWEYNNLPVTVRKGFELFAEQYLNKFRINESVSYVNAKIKSGDSNYRSGRKIPGVSSVKATLGANYEIVDGLRLFTDYNYYSSSYDNKENKIKSYGIANLGLNYKHRKGLGLEFGIKNVFNKKYNYHQTTTEAIETYKIKARTEYMPAPGRTYYLGINYEF